MNTRELNKYIPALATWCNLLLPNLIAEYKNVKHIFCVSCINRDILCIIEKFCISLKELGRILGRGRMERPEKLIANAISGEIVGWNGKRI